MPTPARFHSVAAPVSLIAQAPLKDFSVEAPRLKKPDKRKSSISHLYLIFAFAFCIRLRPPGVNTSSMEPALASAGDVDADFTDGMRNREDPGLL